MNTQQKNILLTKKKNSKNGKCKMENPLGATKISNKLIIKYALQFEMFFGKIQFVVCGTTV